MRQPEESESKFSLWRVSLSTLQAEEFHQDMCPWNNVSFLVTDDESIFFSCNDKVYKLSIQAGPTASPTIIASGLVGEIGYDIAQIRGQYLYFNRGGSVENSIFRTPLDGTEQTVPEKVAGKVGVFDVSPEGDVLFSTSSANTMMYYLASQALTVPVGPSSWPGSFSFPSITPSSLYWVMYKTNSSTTKQESFVYRVDRNNLNNQELFFQEASSVQVLVVDESDRVFYYSLGQVAPLPITMRAGSSKKKFAVSDYNFLNPSRTRYHQGVVYTMGGFPQAGSPTYFLRLPIKD
jgi:hypothetical protein